MLTRQKVRDKKTQRKKIKEAVVDLFFFSSRRRHTSFDCDWSSDALQIAEPELVELRGLRLAPPAVGLVRDEDRRLPRAPQPVCELLLDRDDAVLRVDDEEDEVRLVDGDVGLAAHGVLETGDAADRVPRARPRYLIEPTRVDERELPAAPLDGAVQPVARRPGQILDDRQPLADESVEKGGLADVGAADDSDDRAGHVRRRALPRAPSLR